MTKQVLIKISGLQFAEDGEEPEPVEVLLPGEYYKKNGKHFLLYDESVEGFDKLTKNLLKFDAKKVEVSKKGPVTVQMVFEENKKNLSFYQTPYGMMQMGVAATKIRVSEEADEIDVLVEYVLDVNEKYLADCVIEMTITANEKQPVPVG